jgi:hypothetical protein
MIILGKLFFFITCIIIYPIVYTARLLHFEKEMFLFLIEHRNQLKIISIKNYDWKTVKRMDDRFPFSDNNSLIISHIIWIFLYLILLVTKNTLIFIAFLPNIFLLFVFKYLLFSNINLICYLTLIFGGSYDIRYTLNKVKWFLFKKDSQITSIIILSNILKNNKKKEVKPILNFSNHILFDKNLVTNIFKFY